MKLTELKLHNWRSFYGTPPTLFFSTDSEKNVTVFHAPNGSGKTNLLNAFLWLFAKSTTPSFSRAHQLINHQAIQEASAGETVECSVECKFVHQGRTHRALRSAHCKRLDSIDESVEGTREGDLRIMYQDDTGAWSEASNPQDLIDAVFPPTIRDFFFFDGEELRAKFRHEAKRQRDLATQMQVFFGLGVFLEAQKATAAAEKKLRGSSDFAGDDELERLNKEQAELDDAESKGRAALQKAIEEVSLQEEKINRISQKLEENAEVKRLEEERKAKTAECERIEEDLSINRKARARLIGLGGFPVFLDGPLERLASQISDLESKGELPSDVKRPFLEKLLEAHECLCGRDLEEGTDSRAKVEEWLGRSGLSEVEERVLRMAGQFDQLSRSQGEFWESLEELQKARADLVSRLRVARARTGEIGAEMHAASDEEVRDLEEARDRAISLKEEALEAQGTARGRLETIDEERKRIQGEIAKHKSQNAAAETARRRQSVAAEASALITELFAARDSQMRADLLARIKRRYSELTIKEYSPRLSADYRLELVDDSSGSDVPVGLSGGETQQLAFAFVGSVIEIQREHSETDSLGVGVDATSIPIVMDSPYGQLSGAYRAAVSRYIPEVADQVIVLVTDSQWEGAAASSLRDRVGASFVMKQHATQETIAKHMVGSVTLGGREYKFVEPTQTGYEWTEILEVSDA